MFATCFVLSNLWVSIGIRNQLLMDLSLRMVDVLETLNLIKYPSAEFHSIPSDEVQFKFLQTKSSEVCVTVDCLQNTLFNGNYHSHSLKSAEGICAVETILNIRGNSSNEVPTMVNRTRKSIDDAVNILLNVVKSYGIANCYGYCLVFCTNMPVYIFYI
jgi:hypothetical protein